MLPLIVICCKAEMIMDGDPVIRPVVDLSDVEKGAKEIGGMLSTDRTIGISGDTSRAMAGAVGLKAPADKVQNGSGKQESQANPVDGDNVAISGNNFYIRSDNDIRLLASEMAAFTRSGQRALGMPAAQH